MPYFTPGHAVDHECKPEDGNMLNVVSSLTGFDLQARDGSLGTVSDFLFDDGIWKVRWIVIDTGRWLTGRKVLCSATRVVAGPRQPDGRPLRARKMAWLTLSGKQRCRHRGIF
jgi:hypothetical protein